MSKPPIITRRSLLAGFWLASVSSAWAQVRGGRSGDDQGIGGTGAARIGDDHGIGGTGIVGVIQRFGSIFVNGERIGYAPDVPVRINGESASVKALRIGHVARVVAMRQANGALTTRGISAVSEVIGPIQSVGAGEMSVLGQKVAFAGRESWRPGTYVAVSGLRRTDGVIVASLIEKRRDNATRVTGLLERDRDGVRIGGLRLAGADLALAGQRVHAEGQFAQGVMQVARARRDDFSDLTGASRLSIEGYVRRVGDNLQFGSGYVARDVSRFQPAAGDARVVVNAVLDSSHGLRVESVQSVSQFPGASIGNPAGPARAPGSAPGQGGTHVPGGSPQGPASGPGRASDPGAPTSPGGGPGFPGGPSGPGGFGGPGGGGPGGFGGGGMGGGGGRR
ncbi:hypothetical protein JQ629_19775 [Bradyrhizobium sp. AUGA SZCCT0222]|uniref:DUF5666 domain-containing protein n=1 Tax=Bradyrhizobium sp. AUGA SZCCT0222 TaxID=2807668 RepID=UPI001BAA0948|nr:DUF5666 domain-containing protein [Bradyrhizobium sp. AUGA SZCCT0222]MBR1269755.1 hypothetical protein [Bradyrhizobium sp. AUGA SZCCT0222]